MASETDRVPDVEGDRPEVANDNEPRTNPTIVEFPEPLPEELIEPVARTLARVLVARALEKLGVTPANDE